MKIIPVVVLGAAFAALSLGNSQSLEFKKFSVSSNQRERVTGILCSSAKSCVIGTDVFGGGGGLFASNGTSVSSRLYNGADQGVSFFGFSKVGNLTFAHANKANAFLHALGDPTQVGNWKFIPFAQVPGLSAQKGMGRKDDRTVLAVKAHWSETSDELGNGALFEAIWSPANNVPNDFRTLNTQANQTLCRSEPGNSVLPEKVQNMYVAPDLSILLYGTNFNDSNSEKAAVCISTDGGKRFYRGELPGLGSRDHPIGMTCTSPDKCFAFNSKVTMSYVENDFLYYTTNAQQNPKSVWKPAKLPTLREGSELTFLFFSPDGKNGWLGGNVEKSAPLLLSSNDGGETWRDSTASIRGLAADEQIHSGFALDASTIWLGTNKGTVITSAK
jgi:hypothetical protein